MPSAIRRPNGSKPMKKPIGKKVKTTTVAKRTGRSIPKMPAKPVKRAASRVQTRRVGKRY